MSEEKMQEKVKEYINSEFDVVKFKNIKINKKSINVKFINTSGNEYSVTLNKAEFEE